MSMSRKNLTAKVAAHILAGGIVTCQEEKVDMRSGARKLLWVGPYRGERAGLQRFALMHNTSRAPHDTQYFADAVQAAALFVATCGAKRVEWEAHFQCPTAPMYDERPSAVQGPVPTVLPVLLTRAQEDAVIALHHATSLAYECLTLMGHSYTYATFAQLTREALQAQRKEQYLAVEFGQIRAQEVARAAQWWGLSD